MKILLNFYFTSLIVVDVLKQKTENYTDYDDFSLFADYYDYDVTTRHRDVRTYESCLLFDDDTVMYETEVIFKKDEDENDFVLKHIHLNVSLIQ